MSSDVLEKIDYVLVKIDELSSNVFEEIAQKDFVMVNIDVDADNQPFALFVKKRFTTHREPSSWFVAYIDNTGATKNTVIYDIHPQKWAEEQGYVLLFYDAAKRD